PATRKRHDGVSVLLRIDLQGDFEITAGYELLKLDPPQAGHGVGFHLEYTTATARKAHTSLSRLLRVNEGDVYWGGRQTTTDDGRDHYDQHWVPTTARSGQLRLTRVGETAGCWVAEGGASEFQKLFEF